MKKPSKREENKLRKMGYRYIAGIDEVGRGALAGPIVAACVILPDGFVCRGLRDSKSLSQKQREELFLIITKNAISWSVGKISNVLIDKIGIQEANAQVFKEVLKKISRSPDYVLIDGKEITSLPFPNNYIIQGDERVVSIAAASIVAKVSRDHLMRCEHEKMPQYGFDKHKGYGTLRHIKAIHEHGPSHIHRKTFLTKI